MVEAAILTCRWPGLPPTPPSKRYGFCLRRFFMVNLPRGREIQGSLGVRGLLLRSILRLVRLNGLSVGGVFSSRLPRHTLLKNSLIQWVHLPARACVDYPTAFG